MVNIVSSLSDALNELEDIQFIYSDGSNPLITQNTPGRFLTNNNERHPDNFTYLLVNKSATKNINLSLLFDSLRSTEGLVLDLKSLTSVNNFFKFSVDSIASYGEYFRIYVTLLGDFFLGELIDEEVYTYSFDIKNKNYKTSELQNDGEDGENKFITALDLDDRLDVLEGYVDVSNTFIVKPAFSLSTNILTIAALGRWKLNGVTYTNLASASFAIAYCATGRTRLDYFVPNSSNGFTRISGIETLGMAIAPQLPNENLYVTYVLVTDSSVGNPVTPPAIIIPTIDQVLSSGFATPRFIWFFNNINSLCTRFASDHILFQKLESVFNFIRADNTTQSYVTQMPNKLGGLVETFAMLSDVRPPAFGTFTWIARGTNHENNFPIAGDIFQGMISATEFSNTLKWNGYGELNNSNLANFNMSNSSEWEQPTLRSSSISVVNHPNIPTRDPVPETETAYFMALDDLAYLTEAVTLYGNPGLTTLKTIGSYGMGGAIVEVNEFGIIINVTYQA